MQAIITIEDVLIVRRLESGWLCEIAGRPAFLATLQVARGTAVPEEGRRGPVTMTGAGAADLGVHRRRTA